MRLASGFTRPDITPGCSLTNTSLRICEAVGPPVNPLYPIINLQSNSTNSSLPTSDARSKIGVSPRPSTPLPVPLELRRVLIEEQQGEKHLLEITAWVLITIAGAALISYVTTVAVDDYMRSRRTGVDVEYTWLVFRRTMMASSAIVASIYGFSQASDILEALAKVFRG